MPTVRVALVGTFNTRGIDGDGTLTLNEDQRFLNCTFNLVQNPVTGKATIYAEKRPGWGVDSLVASGSASTGLIKPQSFNAVITAFGDTNSTIYQGTISVGTITGRALHFTETIVSDTTYVMIKSSDGTGWYLADDAASVTAYTCDTNGTTTISDIKIAGVQSVAGLYVGQLLAGTDFAAGTRIVSINAGAFSAVISAAATGTTGDLATTKTPIAKIMDADFDTSGMSISAFVEMDGYLFYTTSDDGKLWNSDLNTIDTYTATGFISPNMSPDPPVAVYRQKNLVGVLGGASNEVFFNAGNATGSPLQRAPQYFQRIGCLDQRSLTTIENEVYFVSTPHVGDVGVYRIRDMSFAKVSTPNVDRIIGTVSATGGAIYVSSFRIGGYPYVGLFMSLAADGPESMILLESGDKVLLESGDDIVLENNPAELASFARYMVLNAQLNIWSEWNCALATFVDGVGSGSANQIVATSRVSTSGKVYTINPVSDGPLYTDDGSAYTMEIRTGKLDLGSGGRKFIECVELIGADSAAGNTPYLSYSDDDYQTWSTPRAFDTSQPEPRLYRVGSHKGGRAWKITDSSNAPFRAEALAITYSQAST